MTVVACARLDRHRRMGYGRTAAATTTLCEAHRFSVPAQLCENNEPIEVATKLRENTNLQATQHVEFTGRPLAIQGQY